ncbi:hypothetical protein PTMSG1_00766 [Pyrenophora teres f. maculata]|nr:hypothetical protein PTMSG1_00766 [Pyrenophora teres f. maculata]
MRQSIATLTLLLATTACAQDVVSFFFPGGYDGVDPVATINVANPSTTEFHIACPTGPKTMECGWGPGLDVTILSQTRFQAEMSTEGVSMSLGCDYNTKAIQMTCTVNQKGGNDDTGGKAVTATLQKEDVNFLTATVVAGQSLLSRTGSASASLTSTRPSAAPQSTASPAVASATTTSASPKSASSTASMTPSASMSSSSTAMASASTASATQTSSSSTPESTGAATRHGIQGSALLALVGAAALHLW